MGTHERSPGGRRGRSRRAEAAPGRHGRRQGRRDTADPGILADIRETAPERTRGRWHLPHPGRGALLGVAALVLVGAGAVHLHERGSALPLTAEPSIGAAADGAADGTGTTGRAAPSSGTASTGAPAAAAAGPVASPTGGNDSGSGGAATQVVIHVTGAVTTPGVVTLPAGSRVSDAVRAAGGARPDADLAAVNLARVLADGEQIHVPVPGEEPPAVAAASAPAAAATPGAREAGAAAPAGGTGVVDLNTATAEQLDALPGVGPAIARRIVEHRDANGPFRSVDDLEQVAGIGPATLEKIRPQARV